MLDNIINIFPILIIILSLQFSFLKNQKLSEKDLAKIKKGIFADSYMLSQNELFYNQTLSKGEINKIRKLDENEITI